MGVWSVTRNGAPARRGRLAEVVLIAGAALTSGCSQNWYVSIVEGNPPTDGFDFPVAPGEMDGWVEPPAPEERFDPSSYLVDRDDGIHAAIDFFKEGGESAAGHPLWCIGDGVVVDIVWDREAYPDRHEGGKEDAAWGNLIVVQHDYEEDGERKKVWSQYAHLQTVDVEVGDTVSRGQAIGTIGKTDGDATQEMWDTEHLHFELRVQALNAHVYPDDLGVTTAAAAPEFYVHPLEFIRAHRPPSE